MPNLYFENKKLKKMINYSDQGTAIIAGTAIKWKKGMGNANGFGHVTKGAKRPFEEDSFFGWFNEA
ncbi:hypothetical protein IEQ34_015799 [Dendrobium chrysotoxum]|uniref:Uncharacterized protein n=1 Tax=Dendrobium chrysotoxum TaxID=161865 RepID=A0AAV7GIM1_DENCH|nr:hypothetical protein IEQ34_015799 [Dendrobium chrysotoxum]